MSQPASATMKKFVVIIEGRNVYIRLEEATNRVGFFATRFIESENREAAEETALALIKSELLDVILNERSNPPVMLIEDVMEVNSFDEDNSGSGFTWFPEEKQDPDAANDHGWA